MNGNEAPSDVVHSSSATKFADKSWRATFKPNLELRARAHAYVKELHEKAHQKASLVDPCWKCGYEGKASATRKPEFPVPSVDSELNVAEISTVSAPNG